MVFTLNRDIIESLFGSFIADNLNKISCILFFLGFVYVFFLKDNTNYRRRKPKKKKPILTYGKERIYFNERDESKWSPTGWFWDEKSGKWIPPDYTCEESNRRWAWDEEKKIWIDLDKADKMEKYREFRKGKEPTFEEWKKAREAEQTSDSDSTT